jgi:hypothetical protein
VTKTEAAAAIAQKIDAHLRRIECDPTLNPGQRLDKDRREWVLDPTGPRPYYRARAAVGKRHRVRVIYVSYQAGSYMSIEEAERYLAWLDVGNVGRHFEALREAAS